MIKTQSRWPIVVLIVAALAAVLGSLSPTVAWAQAQTTTTNTRIPIPQNSAVTVNGETFQVSGSLHALFHVTRDNAGGFHIQAHLNGQGIRAVSGGTSYRVNTADNLTVNVGATKGAASNFTGVANFGLIGQGQAPNLRLHVNLHGTVNANGEVTATVANVRITST
ncbi:MAG: hypothetical protein M3P24_04610 [Gemmatimonadota bacterium]|nr:hypothetical protein [Gemmatimonadota bacterium]